jgi:hypothetical protein
MVPIGVESVVEYILRFLEPPFPGDLGSSLTTTSRVRRRPVIYRELSVKLSERKISRLTAVGAAFLGPPADIACLSDRTSASRFVSSSTQLTKLK